MVVARTTLGLAGLVAVLHVTPGGTLLRPPIGTTASVAAAAVVVLVAASRGSDEAVLWSMRTFTAIGLLAVYAGVLATPGGGVSVIGVMGFVFVLGAVGLPARDNVAALALGTALLLAIVARGPIDVLWPVIPSIAIGLLGHGTVRAFERSLRQLDDERQAARSASTALRAVVEAAGDATTDDVEEVLDAVTRATARLGCDTAGLLLISAPDHMSYGGTLNVPERQAAAGLAIDEGLAGQVVAAGATVLVGDYQAYSHALEDDRDVRLRAAMGAPITVDGDVVGALVGGRYGSTPFDDASVSAFELLAGHAGGAIALARAIGEDRATLAQLRRLESLQEDFVSTVSHELRTPLTVIDGAAETLVQLGDRLGPELRETLLGRIASNARNLNQVVTSILEMARLDRGLAEFEPDTVDVTAMVLRCVARLDPVLVDHDVRLDVAPAIAVGDEALLERVVDNLLLNAARHTPVGTVVVVRTETGPDRVEVAVEDDGPGIPAHELGSITERFRRAGSPTTRETRGLGIGLALVDQVLRLHGARLRITSEVGAGTTFSFRLTPSVLHSARAGPSDQDGAHPSRREGSPPPDERPAHVTALETPDAASQGQ